MAKKSESAAATTKLTLATLDCKLTDPERLDRGRDLALTLSDIQNEGSRQESMKREMKAKLAELEARRDSLSSVVQRGSELRAVEVEDRIDHERDKYTRTRLDTGEVIRERALLPEERQTAAL